MSSCEVPVILDRFLIKLDISWNFRNFSNTRSHENLSSEIRVVPRKQADEQTDGRRDGRDEANSRFYKFFERF
jgi:hypothetical protein